MSKPGSAPTDEEIESYLVQDLALRAAKGEPAEFALDANYELGLSLREAIVTRYPDQPPSPTPIRWGTKLTKVLKIVAGYAVAITIGWALSRYWSSAIPYVVGLVVLLAFGYHQSKIEELEEDFGATERALNERIDQLEAIIRAPERQAMMDDFEQWRSAQGG